MNIAQYSEHSEIPPILNSANNSLLNFFYKQYESLTDHALEWDHFVPEDHPLQSRHLLILEKSKSEDLKFRYSFVYKNSNSTPPQLLAVLYFQIVQFNSHHYLSPFSNNAIFHFIEKIVMRKKFVILTCGNLFRIDFPGIYFNQKVISSKEIAEITHKLFQLFRPKPHVILMKDAIKEWGQQLGKYGFQLWNNDLTMKMDIDRNWRNFDDYTASLRHKYSQRVRRSRNQIKGVSRIELSLKQIIDQGDRLEELYLQVVWKQPIRLVIATKNYFIQMKITYGQQFKVFGYFDGDTMVAFSSNILYATSWELHYIGMDYTKNAEYWIYFNIMFDAISDAIEERKTELELGRTAREAKAIIGGNPIYFQSYFLIKSGFVNYMVNILTDFFNKNAGQDWKKHHPFKAMLK